MKSALNDFNTIDSESGIVTEQRRRGRPRASARNKRIKVEEEGGTTAFPASSSPVQNSPQTTPATQPPDANMVLKFTYGVNAWKHWVVQKNAQLEQISAGKKLKKFKTDILQCSVEELNNSLCLFVKEVRKPNGEEYAPDSIYYLCLGESGVWALETWICSGGSINIDGLAQDCNNSSANALELLQSCSKPSNYLAVIHQHFICRKTFFPDIGIPFMFR